MLTSSLIENHTIKFTFLTKLSSLLVYVKDKHNSL